jgi:hypothetical protein
LIGSFLPFSTVSTQSGPRRGYQFALHQTAGGLLDHLVGNGESRWPAVAGVYLIN